MFYCRNIFGRISKFSQKTFLPDLFEQEISILLSFNFANIILPLENFESILLDLMS